MVADGFRDVAQLHFVPVIVTSVKHAFEISSLDLQDIAAVCTTAETYFRYFTRRLASAEDVSKHAGSSRDTQAYSHLRTEHRSPGEI